MAMGRSAWVKELNMSRRASLRKFIPTILALVLLIHAPVMPCNLIYSRARDLLRYQGY